MFILAITLILLALFGYFKIWKPYKYWQDKAVPHVKPWPIFGNMAENLFSTRSFAHIIQDMYEKFPNHRYFGFHHYSKPCIMLRDPLLIKQICVTDFEILPDHPPFLPEDADPFFSKNLLILKGKSWRTMRNSLSPLFTTSKLKEMFGLMVESSEEFVRYFEDQPGKATKVNGRDAFTRYTNDLAANLALGVSCNSMADKENEIFTSANKNFNNVSCIKFFGYAVSPALMKLFKVRFFDSTLLKFLSGIIQESMKIRKNKGIVRIDILHLLMQAKKGRLSKGPIGNDTVDSGCAALQESEDDNRKNMKITDEDIIAQAVLFYAAGFDTSANFLCMLTYELAVNQDIQDKLYKEVVETLKICDDEVTFDALLGMKYLDMVILETLRLWPVTTFSDRMSAKPYTIEPTTPGEKSVNVDVGTLFWLPIYSLHRNPEYFPNPSKFDPERFNNKNKQNIRSYTYIPFGVGPRACIASRFALLEAKVIIFYILWKFKIVPVEETEIPIILSKKNINLATDSGPVLSFQLRQSSKKKLNQ